MLILMVDMLNYISRYVCMRTKARLRMNFEVEIVHSVFKGEHTL